MKDLANFVRVHTHILAKKIKVPVILTKLSTGTTKTEVYNKSLHSLSPRLKRKNWLSCVFSFYKCEFIVT